MRVFHLGRLVTFLVLVGSAISLSACGGGGGGGGGGYVVPAEYTGETAQATVTSDNAEEIALAVFDGGGTAIDMFIPPPSVAGPAAAALPLVATLESVVGKMELTSPVGPAEAACVYDATGGSACFTLAVDDGTTFSGTMAFTNYRDDGSLSLTGAVGFTGILNPATETLQMTLTFQTLTASTGDDPFDLYGSVSFTVSLADTATAGDRVGVRMVMASQSMQMFHDYTLTVSGSPDGERISIGGRFYSGDFGFVVVSTVEPLRTLAAGGPPAFGKLKFEGHRSSATMSFGSAGAYTIECSDGGPPIPGILN